MKFYRVSRLKIDLHPGLCFQISIRQKLLVSLKLGNIALFVSKFFSLKPYIYLFESYSYIFRVV